MPDVAGAIRPKVVTDVHLAPGAIRPSIAIDVRQARIASRLRGENALPAGLHSARRNAADLSMPVVALPASRSAAAPSAPPGWAADRAPTSEGTAARRAVAPARQAVAAARQAVAPARRRSAHGDATLGHDVPMIATVRRNADLLPLPRAHVSTNVHGGSARWDSNRAIGSEATVDRGRIAGLPLRVRSHRAANR